jgi:hypothetical protein
MALRKIIEAEGNSIVYTSIGEIENGTQRVSFSAYIKVFSVEGNKNEIVAEINFKGEAHEFYKKYQVPVSVETNAPNFIAQVYAHLKTLPEFNGAENC